VKSNIEEKSKNRSNSPLIGFFYLEQASLTI